MAVPVLTAVSDAVWESDLVAALERGDLGVAVVRRCVDLADLLATAATGSARAVLLSADLRRLDREALTRLDAAGVAVLGLVPAGDEAAERRLRQLGVPTVLSADSPAGAIADAVVLAVGGPAGAPRLPSLGRAADPRDALAADPWDGLPADPRDGLPADARDGLPANPREGRTPGSASGDVQGRLQGGRLVAVWGPTGAPGRTTVAVGLATELAARGRSTLLVDADVYGGVVAQVLGLLDEAPGLAAACRLGNAGTLDVPGLAGLARRLSPTLRVLTGIARADRWPELRPAALEVVLSLARRLSEVTVVDCAFGLEQDEELAYDTAAPRRNGATLAVLEQADVVLAVGSADPVGLQRLVRGLAELKDAVPGVAPRVVVNRLRASAVPGNAEAEVRAALGRYAGVVDITVVPHDVAGVDAALAAGRSLAEASPGSPVRAALAGLAGSLDDRPAPPARRRRLLQR